MKNLSMPGLAVAAVIFIGAQLVLDANAAWLADRRLTTYAHMLVAVAVTLTYVGARWVSRRRPSTR